MNIKEINLFVFDQKANYANTERFIGKSMFKSIRCIENADEFLSEFEKLEDDEFVFLAVHVFYTMGISGVRDFIASNIFNDYPFLKYCYISEGDRSTIQHEMIDKGIRVEETYRYHEVASNLLNDSFKARRKRDILNFKPTNATETVTNNSYPKFDYAILTALYDDEFEELLEVFDFPHDGAIDAKTKLYRIGTLKNDPSKRVVACFLNATGLIDAAVITTQMLELFRPKYILMSGVCGGKEGLNFGDIVVAKQLFAFQKGKLSDHQSFLEAYKNENEEEIVLYDAKGNPVDIGRLFDSKKNQVSASLDHFELEHDAMINLNSGFEDKLNGYKKTIESKVNEAVKHQFRILHKIPQVNVHIEPMASGTMVINKRGYFEKIIKSVSRKVAAVEMEGYGVARACQFANKGNTIPIIFKSVMDHTQNKNDSKDELNVKKFAAYTSAQFMKQLFEFNVI